MTVVTEYHCDYDVLVRYRAQWNHRPISGSVLAFNRILLVSSAPAAWSATEG